LKTSSTQIVINFQVGKFGEQLLELLNQGGGSKITTPDSATGAAAAPLVQAITFGLFSSPSRSYESSTLIPIPYPKSK